MLDQACGHPPRTCQDDQWLVRSPGGESGGKDLALRCALVAQTSASYPPPVLLLGYALTSRNTHSGLTTNKI